MGRKLMTAWLVYTLVATALVAVMAGVLRRRDAEVERLEGNARALGREIVRYRTENGDQAASIRTLELTVDQFRQTCTRQEREIGELGLKVSRLRSMATTAVETRVDTVTRFVPVHHYAEGGTPEGRLEWSDPWVSLSATVGDDTARVSLSSRDTLVQVVHRVPRRFLFIRFGTKCLRQEMVCSNPHTTITYAERIDIVK